MREELKKEVIEALKFLEEAGYPVSSTEDILEGYISLKEAVEQILNETGIKYDELDLATVEEALQEYKDDF